MFEKVWVRMFTFGVDFLLILLEQVTLDTFVNGILLKSITLFYVAYLN